MTTDFFKQLYQISAIGTFNISLKVGSNDMMLMALVFTPESGSVLANKPIPPLVFKGTVEEFTAQFFDRLVSPVKKTNEFFVNAELFNKTIDKAKLDLAKSASKKKSPESKPEIDQDSENEDETEFQPVVSKAQKKQSYTDAMAEVEELTVRFKYEQALAVLPLVADFPDKEKQILAKEKDLKFQARQYSLL